MYLASPRCPVAGLTTSTRKIMSNSTDGFSQEDIAALARKFWEEASTIAREYHDVSKLSAFFDCIHQDPVISTVKLIAEPWDVGEGGYQVGNFPVLWQEWNGKYRDCVRAYWKGDMGLLGELAYRLTGSADLFEHGGRRPYSSVNIITAHDGRESCA